MAGALVLAVLAAGATYAFLAEPGGDVLNEDIEFRAEPTPTPMPAEEEQEREPSPKRKASPDQTWPIYGFSKDRRRHLPASSKLRPPFRKLWTMTGTILLEFSPVLARQRLFLLKNNGAVYSIDKDSGEVYWKRKMGELAASSPAFAEGTVYITVLERGKTVKAGRVAAMRASDGKVLWDRRLPSRTESSPLVDGEHLFFGSEDGTVYCVRRSDGAVRWTYKAPGAVKGALALADGKLYFGDYAGRMHAIRRSDGRAVWTTGTRGARFGTAAGQFYSTPAVAYGRVYIGNTDGKVYSFSASTGRIAWTRSTGGYVYASPAVAQVPGGKPTVYAGSYSGRFFALDARTGRPRWERGGFGRISGGATVVGDIVYFADYGNTDTIGLAARTGRTMFKFPSGSFNPVISDGRTIFLTGFGSLQALRPPSAAARRARKEALARAERIRRRTAREIRSTCRKRALRSDAGRAARVRIVRRCFKQERRARTLAACRRTAAATTSGRRAEARAYRRCARRTLR